MRIRAQLERDWRFIRGLNRTLKRVKSIAPASDHLVCDDIQDAVEEWRDRPALTFEYKTLTYGEMDALTIRANAARRAYGLQAQGSADRLEGSMAASRARTQGYTTLLSSAGDVYKGGQASGWWGGK